MLHLTGQNKFLLCGKQATTYVPVSHPLWLSNLCLCFGLISGVLLGLLPMPWVFAGDNTQSLQGTIDLLDGSNISGASHGKIEGSGVGGLGIGTLLQDLRETYLEMFGGTGKHRDRAAKLFDAKLRDIAANASDLP